MSCPQDGQDSIRQNRQKKIRPLSSRVYRQHNLVCQQIYCYYTKKNIRRTTPVLTRPSRRRKTPSPYTNPTLLQRDLYHRRPSGKIRLPHPPLAKDFLGRFNLCGHNFVDVTDVTGTTASIKDASAHRMEPFICSALRLYADVMSYETIQDHTIPYHNGIIPYLIHTVR